MTKQFFLWPQARNLSAKDAFGPSCSSEDIEEELRALFPASDPVLFSSARAGLSAVLQILELSRPDRVWTPPYSSHCVLDAIGRVCTPTPSATDPNNLAAALVYHQWGYIHAADFSPQVKVIEDAVDSLLIPGTSPFAVGGDFALWSLPKVLATLAGGVVFCRHAKDASTLRTIRHSRPISSLQAWLRWRSESSIWAARYWNGAEADQGGLPAVMRRQVLSRLASLERLVDERRTMIRGLSASLLTGLEASGRLPSNLPMTVPRQWQAVWRSDALCSAGLRSFNTDRHAPDGCWTKVAPLPVHADVSADTVRAILDRLDLKGFCDEFDFV